MGFASGFINTKKKKQEPIAYECENCGAKVTAYGQIPRCLGCGKALCDICNNYMLCGTDFNRLEKRDQKKVKRIGMSLESAKTSKKMFTIMPLVMGGIGVILLLLMIILRDEIFYFMFGFLGGFLLLSALMMLGVFHNFEERETARISNQIKGIVLPYNIQRAPSGPTKIKIVQCPNCSGNVDPSSLICEWCGSTLKETPIDS